MSLELQSLFIIFIIQNEEDMRRDKILTRSILNHLQSPHQSLSLDIPKSNNNKKLNIFCLPYKNDWAIHSLFYFQNILWGP